jgi:transposase
LAIYTLSASQWARILPVLPRASGRGRPRADDRKVLEGILRVLSTGCSWHDLPADSVSPTTCWRRLAQWQVDGTWERVWLALLSDMDAIERDLWVRAFLAGAFVPAKAGTVSGTRRA